VIVLGFDGLTWSVMKPLLEAGRLPNFARLILDGAVGYLNNGDRSYSPEIWNTIFSGRKPSDHSISEFRKLVLPRSGQAFSRLLIMPPTPHTFFGIRQLVEMVPHPRLWELHLANSTDRRVKVIWEIASDFARHVVVANPITSRPVQPVKGSMIIYGDRHDPLAAYPPVLALEWHRFFTDSAGPLGGWTSHVGDPHKLIYRAQVEADFTLDLFARETFDLGVYFCGVADHVSHVGWNFYARKDGFLTRLPLQLDNDSWESLVLEHSDEAVPQAYLFLDATLGRFLEQFENANYIIVSDHGWSYSGFEHAASPDGIVILSGPTFRKGLALTQARIEDIAPTALAIIGIPLSGELAGRPLFDALRSTPDIVSVSSYGEPRPTRGIGQSTVDKEQLKRLKALGYIN
jgi:predicted AlkP superfamily phosphohydrolase/phosphomutase